MRPRAPSISSSGSATSLSIRIRGPHASSSIAPSPCAISGRRSRKRTPRPRADPMTRSSRVRGWLFAWLTCVVLFLAAPARAWNETGHMIVAYIAYRHLTPQARYVVDRLLTLNPDVEAWKATLPPNWDDNARRLAAFMYAA